MLVPESEAKTKVCPALAGSRPRCVGSDCMWWQQVTVAGADLGYCGIGGQPPQVQQSLLYEMMGAVAAVTGQTLPPMPGPTKQ